VAYMLRLWQARDDERAVWRASLEDPHTGEVAAFATLAALTAFLQAMSGGSASDGERGRAAAPEQLLGTSKETS